jgi:hypothetical protein
MFHRRRRLLSSSSPVLSSFVNPSAQFVILYRSDSSVPKEGTLFQGLMQPQLRSDHLRHFCAKVKDAYVFTYNPPHSSFVVLKDCG